MGGGTKAPKSPDYVQLANIQGQQQRDLLEQQTAANRPNQITPDGSVTWAKDANGNWTQTTTLSPEQQALRDSANQANQAVLDKANQLAGMPGFQGPEALGQYGGYDMTTGQYTPGGQLPTYDARQVNTGVFNPADLGIGTYDPASGDAYAKQFSEALLARVNPQQAQDRSAMESKLRLQGLVPGTEAYDRAYKNLLTSQGDVQSQAQLQGMLAGTQEARSNYNTQLQSALSQAQNARENYGTTLQGDLALTQNQRDDFNTMLQRAMSQGSENRADYNTQLGYDTAAAANSAQNYQLQAAGQNQNYSQAMQNYLLPWQTAAYTQGLAQGTGTANVNAPNFSQAGQGQANDSINAAQQQYAQQMQRYNEQQAQSQGKWSTIGSIAGGAIGGIAGGPAGAYAGANIGGAAGGYIGSDISLKDDVQKVSDEEAFEIMQRLIPVSWSWKADGKQDAGIIAQDVEKYLPDLVRKAEAGHLEVNYTTLFAVALGAFRHLAKGARA